VGVFDYLTRRKVRDLEDRLNTDVGGVLTVTGAKGDQGDPGPAGPAGPGGPAGPRGADGFAGPTGPKGDKGDTGAQGSPGAPGPSGGPPGPTGPAGDQGVPGAAGPAGPRGADGSDGSAGPAGPAGARGPAGDVGPAGPSGQPGPKGDKGDKGDTGPAGSGGGGGGGGGGNATPMVAEKFDSMPANLHYPVGSAANFALDTGQLKIVANAETVLFRSALTTIDSKQIIKVTASNNGEVSVGLLARRIDDNNFLMASFYGNDTAAALSIFKKDAGAWTDMSGQAVLGAAIQPGTVWWFVAYFIGRNLRCELWDIDPRKDHDRVIGPRFTRTYTLAAADLAKFGAASGEAGLRLDAASGGGYPNIGGMRLDDWAVMSLDSLDIGSFALAPSAGGGPPTAFAPLSLGAAWTGSLEYQTYPDGSVRLRGAVTHPGGFSWAGIAGEAIATLPAGATPAQDEEFEVPAAEGGTYNNIATVLVRSDGVIQAIGGNLSGGGGATLHLDGIEFSSGTSTGPSDFSIGGPVNGATISYAQTASGKNVAVINKRGTGTGAALFGWAAKTRGDFRTHLAGVSGSALEAPYAAWYNDGGGHNVWIVGYEVDPGAPWVTLTKAQFEADLAANGLPAWGAGALVPNWMP
jgi:hypothetical protein